MSKKKTNPIRKLRNIIRKNRIDTRLSNYRCQSCSSILTLDYVNGVKRLYCLQCTIILRSNND